MQAFVHAEITLTRVEIGPQEHWHITPLTGLLTRVLECLGEPVADDWRAPLPAAAPTPWRDRQREDLRWLREWVLPFLTGRLRGRQTGDGFFPKRPELLPLDERALPG